MCLRIWKKKIIVFTKFLVDDIHEPIFNKENKPINTPKLVGPPVIGPRRYTSKVYVNSSLLVKRSRERPIDEDNTFVTPATNVQRKITFILNNLTELNFQKKVNIRFRKIKIRTARLFELEALKVFSCC